MNENFVATHILMDTIVDIDVETRLYAFISGLYAIATRIVQKMMMKRVHVNGSGMEQTICVGGDTLEIVVWKEASNMMEDKSFFVI